jgi:hypothetical protein
MARTKIPTNISELPYFRATTLVYEVGVLNPYINSDFDHWRTKLSRQTPLHFEVQRSVSKHKLVKTILG